MGKTVNCRSCDEPIEFRKEGGKWIPIDPGSGARHRCKSDVVCESCGVEFKGAPWMKQCSACFRGQDSNANTPATSGLDKDRVFRGRGAPPGAASAREPLEACDDDDFPPF